MSKACRVMGYSRDTFYRYQEAVKDGGLDALLDANKKKSNLRNRVDQRIEDTILNLEIEKPAFGQVRVANELREKGFSTSPGGVRSVWMRHDLETFKKRLKALEKKVAEIGMVLTEAQIVALEKKKDDDVACGEIETQHPRYLGSQDTFYVGTLRGVGRTY